GVACEEINPTTMKSTKIDGLYFIGETVDVTGELGGYNFQWAFSSAVVAAKAIRSTAFKPN
ncbi:MAG: NAD(P)/FAD-dependent oxidoreductase, partial [Sulfuricurvum sp.]|nr:NAD(P)/FAD-dependent oxidoreductase [Sulfuricurvum sp.]